MATASPLIVAGCSLRRVLLPKRKMYITTSPLAITPAFEHLTFQARITSVPLPASMCRIYSSLASFSSSSSSSHRTSFSDESNEKVGRAIIESTSSGSDDAYVSPIQDFWDALESNHGRLWGESGKTENSPITEQHDSSLSSSLRCGIPDSVLRFTTTSYGRTMNAPFVHPKEHSVVLKVSTRYLPLTPMEREILREIVGNRLNDDRNELRLASDQFGSRIENKRHLVSMLDRIVLSCQRLGKELEKNLQQREEED